MYLSMCVMNMCGFRMYWRDVCDISTFYHALHLPKFNFLSFCTLPAVNESIQEKTQSNVFFPYFCLRMVIEIDVWMEIDFCVFVFELTYRLPYRHDGKNICVKQRERWKTHNARERENIIHFRKTFPSISFVYTTVFCSLEIHASVLESCVFRL